MAAFTTGADWSFDGVPGEWQHEDTIREPSHRDHVLQEQTIQEPAHKENLNEKPTQSEVPPPTQSNAESPQSKQWQSRQCRICLEVVHPTFDLFESLPAALRPAPTPKYISEDGGRLLRPCKCKGTQKYVHEDCLTAWRLADPLQKRNYWECPTCRFRYHLQRLTYASYISSTASQIGLTLLILFITMFLLGFVADPIINLYIDPVHTVMSAGGPTGSLIYEDEPASWAEHFIKGLASLGLLGFAKLLFTLNPFNLINARTGGFGVATRGGPGGTGRDRISQIGWIAILVGVITFLVAVWKGVRAWSRRMLQAAGERVLDVPGIADDGDDDNKNE